MALLASVPSRLSCLLKRPRAQLDIISQSADMDPKVIKAFPIRIDQ